MPFVQWLEASFIHSHRKLYGSIIVKGPNKSAASLTKLSDKVLSDLDIVGNPTGDGFSFYLDIVALYYRFVQATTRFQNVLVASRPLLISACFCFMNNDYMPPCHGLKYKDFFAAVRSEPYKQACFEFGHSRLDYGYMHYIQNMCTRRKMTCFIIIQNFALSFQSVDSRSFFHTVGALGSINLS